MADHNNAPSGLSAIFIRVVEQGAGWVIAFLFWFVVVVISIIATAQSGKPWDTLIAAAAAGSQAFFAFMVWQLSKQQYAFTQRVTDRQHKIDAFSLRSEVIANLQELGNKHVFTQNGIWLGAEEGFLDIAKRVTRLFSNTASSIAYQLYEAVLEAVETKLPIPVPKEKAAKVREEKSEIYSAAMADAFDYCNELLDLLEEEARIT